MPEQLELLVVILNYKTPDLVIDCLKSLSADLGPRRKTVIVDNFSNDGSAEKIAEWIEANQLSYVELYLSSSNGGFSYGNNIGIKYLQAENYLLLNSDTLVREGAIDKLLCYAKENSQIGLVSPRLEWPDGIPQISCFRFHSPISEFISTASTKVIDKIFRKYIVPRPLESEVTFCDWVSFACVLVKREVLQTVGMMDDEYFLYYEDADYCRQVKDYGWGIANLPSARVVHLRGGSGDVKKNTQNKKRLPAYYWRSRMRYFKKFYGAFGALAANVCWYLGAFFAVLLRCAGKKEFKPVKDEWKDIWIGFIKS